MFDAPTVLSAMLFAGALSCVMGVVVRAQGSGSLDDVDSTHSENPPKQVRFISNSLFGFGALNIIFGLLLYASLRSSGSDLTNLFSLLLLESIVALLFFLIKGIQRHQAKATPRPASHGRR
jgi:hypothetical protein